MGFEKDKMNIKNRLKKNSIWRTKKDVVAKEGTFTAGTVVKVHLVSEVSVSGADLAEISVAEYGRIEFKDKKKTHLNMGTTSESIYVTMSRDEFDFAFTPEPELEEMADELDEMSFSYLHAYLELFYHAGFAIGLVIFVICFISLFVPNMMDGDILQGFLVAGDIIAAGSILFVIDTFRERKRYDKMLTVINKMSERIAMTI